MQYLKKEHDQPSADQEKEHNQPSTSKSHEKKTSDHKHKRSSRLQESVWYQIEPEEAQELPYDIDCKCAYTLPFDPRYRMRSTKDGRSWKSLTTSTRKNFGGMRRKACCSGSFKCVNRDCTFRRYYQKETCLQFNPSDKTCSVCGKSGLYVPFGAVKIWKFNNNENMVTVFNDGIHTCVARQLFKMSEEVKEKISSGGTTITKSTEDVIIYCLKEENPCWNDVYRVANSTLEQEKLYHAKKKKQMLKIFLMIIVSKQ